MQSGTPRGETATARNDAGILKVDRLLMISALSDHSSLSLCFIDHLLAKNTRYQDDLVNLFFNFSEKRLARVLLELSEAQSESTLIRVIPKISHEAQAE